MKTVGLVGGLGPESTIDYYRSIVRQYQARCDAENYPHIVIDSINLTEARSYVEAKQYDRLTELFLDSLARLVKAGAEFGILAANTAHIVFDQVQSRSAIPLISIVEAVCGRVKAMGFTRVGLLGTAYTMRSTFYPKIFQPQGITLFVPPFEDQEFIQDKIFSELQAGIINDQTRERHVRIVEAMRQRDGIEAVILGCTELPMILKGDDPGIHLPLLDSVEIHVERIIEYMSE